MSGPSPGLPQAPAGLAARVRASFRCLGNAPNRGSAAARRSIAELVPALMAVEECAAYDLTLRAEMEGFISREAASDPGEPESPPLPARTARGLRQWAADFTDLGSPPAQGISPARQRAAALALQEALRQAARAIESADSSPDTGPAGGRPAAAARVAAHGERTVGGTVMAPVAAGLGACLGAAPWIAIVLGAAIGGAWGWLAPLATWGGTAIVLGCAAWACGERCGARARPEPVRRAWRWLRFGANATNGSSVVGLLVALVTPGSWPSRVPTWDRRHAMWVGHDRKGRNPVAKGGGTTFGSVFISKSRSGYDDWPLLRHESRHADQFAVLGFVTLIYLPIHVLLPRERHPFERAAGLWQGGYETNGRRRAVPPGQPPAAAFDQAAT